MGMFFVDAYLKLKRDVIFSEVPIVGKKKLQCCEEFFRLEIGVY